jgi:hypothetical protein
MDRDTSTRAWKYLLTSLGPLAFGEDRTGSGQKRPDSEGEGFDPQERAAFVGSKRLRCFGVPSRLGA